MHKSANEIMSFNNNAEFSKKLIKAKKLKMDLQVQSLIQQNFNMQYQIAISKRDILEQVK